ncbi:MAG TPA: adenylate/guanylate cyclase domain-containing protein [Candidatus Limnocylindria bacterium]|nr:adenylate/guanylate cyclase domain-containing protein [Candidatus Limnocylindria bacterium]
MRRSPRGPERLLATVMFTDIVGSTELATQLGDRGWKSLVARHHAIVRRQLKRFGGRELDTAGDGFFVMFDRPAQAIDCAWAIIDALRPLNIDIRAAVHMGEVEVMGGKVGGIAVHAASRVLGLAKPGQIYVTGIVHDVVAGSDIRFADQGVHELRGVPGEWRLFAVEETATDRALPLEEPADPTARRRSWTPILAALGLGGLATAGAIAVLLANSAPPPAPIEPRPNSVLRIEGPSRAFGSLVEISDPTDIEMGEGALWVISQSGRTLNRVDPATRAVTPIGLPASPTGMAIGGGSVWMTAGFGTAGGGGSLLRVGLNSRTLEPSMALGDGVEGVAVGEGSVWVTNRVRNTLTRIDLTTRAVSGEIDVGQQPQAVTAGEGSVWVANVIDRTVWRIDPQTLASTGETALSDPPQDLVLCHGRLWVTSALGNKLTIIDAATNALQQTLDMPGPPRGVACGSDAVWVAVSSGEVVRIDPTARADFERIEVGGAPEDVAVDGVAVWVSIRE